jgi:hypothetical protein
MSGLAALGLKTPPKNTTVLSACLMSGVQANSDQLTTILTNQENHHDHQQQLE